MDDDDDYYMDEEENEDEILYKPEAAAFERIGGALLGLGTAIDPKEIKGKKLSELSHLFSMRNFTPREKLEYYIEILFIKFNTENILKIDQETIINIISYIPFLEKPEFINPIGFILGYIATDGGKKII